MKLKIKFLKIIFFSLDSEKKSFFIQLEPLLDCNRLSFVKILGLNGVKEKNCVPQTNILD